MPTPLLQTKLFVPPARPGLVLRPRLVERLNAGTRSGHKLTLLSAPAGFGKTTLAGEWIHALGQATPPVAVAWLSLDESDNCQFTPVNVPPVYGKTDPPLYGQSVPGVYGQDAPSLYAGMYRLATGTELTPTNTQDGNSLHRPVS
jgi:hypothetical protein